VAYDLEPLIDGGSFLECPRWRDGRWYVSDFYRHHVLEVRPDGTSTVIAEVPNQPAGLGFLPDGTLLIASMTDRRVLKLVDGELLLHADVSHLAPGNLNDMVVDDAGRAYIGHQGEGNLGFDRVGYPPSFLIRVDPDGGSRIEADGVVFPNGAVITPDGATLIVGETSNGRYVAYPIGANGALGEQRVWAGSGDVPFSPDGCCLDAEGSIWTAAVHEGRFLRIREGGEVVDEIVVPDDQRALACMLGGEDGRTLALVLLGTGDGHPKDRRTASVVTTTVDAPHAGRP
jgi:sugar lactone lactonase YvrE